MKKLNIRKSTILTGINAVGVIVTAALSSRAALKSKKALDEADNPKDKKTILKIVVPKYVPTIISGAGTIAAGVMANKIDGTAIAALGVVGAKAVKDLKDYRDANITINGQEMDDKIMDYLENRNLITDQDGDLETRYWFYDPWDEIWFENCKSDVLNGFAEVNRVLQDPNASGNYGIPTMSDFYMGCSRADLTNSRTDVNGWDLEDLQVNCDCYHLEFWLSKCDDNGNLIPRNAIDANDLMPPKYRLSVAWPPRNINDIDKELIAEGYRD